MRPTRMLAQLLLVSAFASATAAFGWDKLSDDGSCGFGQMFDGPGKTMVMVGQTREQFEAGNVVVAISNENWSNKAPAAE